MLANVDLLARMERSRLEPWQWLEVAPWHHALLQPCSFDVEIGETVKIYTGPHTDTRRDNSPWWEILPPEDGPPRRWVLQPDRFYLAALRQFIRVPEDCCAHIHGVSSRARDGVEIHQQAGLLDPGWCGWATLEIRVANPHTIVYASQRIGQVALTQLSRRADPPYYGRYQADTGPQPARLDVLRGAG